MRIQETLKERLSTAIRKQSVFERDLIRVILAEFSRSPKSEINKDLSDEDALKIMSNMMNDMKITNTEESLKELEYIEEFFPNRMSDFKIKSILSSIITTLNLDKTPKNIGVLKAEFEKTHKGQDGKLIGLLSKELLH